MIATEDCDLGWALSGSLRAIRQVGHQQFHWGNPPPAAVQATLQDRIHPAWRRVKFDELLAQQLSMRMHYDHRRRVNAPPLPPRDGLTRTLLERLPFKLTRSQLKVAAEIRADLARRHPMQRLLQGDVGSGKTIVAALAALQAIENG